ncbi:MAG: HNH endonuclease [Desulfobulbaceae bacterium]|nr:HNH endonuclease [Desulfobulbaceae bacterium]MCK5322505.1 HNH endonuclease [Desulfobulbaceae bacterium]MCK5543570.1 HNH endonuclease [Desulfobulbaceae bacterium]
MRRDTNPGFFFDGVDEAVIRQERAKARELRKSRWWKNKIAKGECHYCGQRTPPAEITMDHIVPLSRGGRSTKANLAPTCKTCNTKKKTMLPIEWEEYMEDLIKK